MILFFFWLCWADEHLALTEWENVEQQHISWEYVEVTEEVEVIIDPYVKDTEDQVLFDYYLESN